MTIEEAVSAARKNVPVVDEDPVIGPILYARIGCIRKSYPLRSDMERGAAEVYGLELLPMSGARSVTIVPPERVRVATPEELRDLRHYQGPPSMPEVHPELLCEEVKSGRPWAERKG